MNKEDLNRQFGDPEKQEPVTPLELLAAAHLIREHCKNIQLCLKCIFHDNEMYSCLLFANTPEEWEISDAEHNAADWIDKQHFQGHGLYTDTDGGSE